MKDDADRRKRVVTGQFDAKDPEDMKELKRIQNERSANFKNTRSRHDAPVYKILAGVPVNANDGMHNPNYVVVDAK